MNPDMSQYVDAVVQFTQYTKILVLAPFAVVALTLGAMGFAHLIIRK